MSTPEITQRTQIPYTNEDARQLSGRDEFRQKVRRAIGKPIIKASLLSNVIRGRDDILADMNESYSPREILKLEGFMRETQAQSLRSLLECSPKVKNIAEIGFNAGHSSFLFLSTRSDIQVTSFDIAEHPYVDKAEQLIADRFPNRHELIRGDSKQTVPAFSERNPNTKYDLIFIDGGHDYETAVLDLENMRQIAAPGCAVIMDDYMPLVDWGKGPSRAWDRAVRQGAIHQESIQSGDGRTWAVGKYLTARG
jgi:predicted O-methyltransferase YrrM